MKTKLIQNRDATVKERSDQTFFECCEQFSELNSSKTVIIRSYKQSLKQAESSS